MGATAMNKRYSPHTDANCRAIALQGRDEEHHRKATQIAARGGIDDDEPLWWIFVSLGYLEDVAGRVPDQIKASTQAFVGEFSKARRAIETAQDKYADMSGQYESLAQSYSAMNDRLEHISHLLASERSVSSKASTKRYWVSLSMSFLAGVLSLALLQSMISSPVVEAEQSGDQTIPSSFIAELEQSGDPTLGGYIISRFDTYPEYFRWMFKYDDCKTQYLSSDVCQLEKDSEEGLSWRPISK